MAAGMQTMVFLSWCLRALCINMKKWEMGHSKGIDSTGGPSWSLGAKSQYKAELLKIDKRPGVKTNSGVEVIFFFNYNGITIF